MMVGVCVSWRGGGRRGDERGRGEKRGEIEMRGRVVGRDKRGGEKREEGRARREWVERPRQRKSERAGEGCKGKSVEGMRTRSLSRKGLYGMGS